MCNRDTTPIRMFLNTDIAYVERGYISLLFENIFQPIFSPESPKPITPALTSTMQRIDMVEGAIKTPYLAVLQLLLTIDRLNVMNSCHKTTQCNEWRCK